MVSTPGCWAEGQACSPQQSPTLNCPVQAFSGEESLAGWGVPRLLPTAEEAPGAPRQLCRR